MTQSRDDVIQKDVQDLHKLGYAQELFRTMGGFSNFAISFSIISILTGAVILFDYGLAWAGTAAALIGWPVVTIFVLLIAASMSEIASAYPTAGGLYYWASKMKNKNWGWWTAWFNLIGQFAIVAGIAYAAAQFLNVSIVTPLLDNFGIDSEHDYDAVWAKCRDLGVVPSFHTPGEGSTFHDSTWFAPLNSTSVTSSTGRAMT